MPRSQLPRLDADELAGRTTPSTKIGTEITSTVEILTE